ncbi:DUF1295 domain-containing protein [Microbacterium sp. STN6]|uniref:DUF1295 domain-containing protein n=1 Tax=Microbacterium sp. STN6 TaxID=2995588 RepID=UPI002260B510|nr:DUF1295 domain-containing protein [Microbacterium sp. STN6]MCX7521483.1 DUF1295 domain-containing protein [Microbacterium sp. STN6]
MEPLGVSIWILVVACVLTWLLSLVTHEHSWVDRVWSILPVAYVWVFAAASALEPRVTLMAALVSVWGARLTFNFARKGGYASGGEDYRWAILRARMRPWQFGLVNLLFIVVYQNVLLLLITLPAWTAYRNQTPLTALDVAAAVVFLALLAGETIADEQQWRFQQAKKRALAAGSEVRPGFVQTGLFGVSRHPNFFFEISQWWVIFFFGAIAARSLTQWTVVGAVLLTLLFVGSTWFTESISRSRYEEYRDYQSRTSAVVPWPARSAAVSRPPRPGRSAPE